MGCVYCVVNKVNGKEYIGESTIGMKYRKFVHQACARKGSKLPLHRDMRKFGFDSFIWKILFKSDDPNELANREALEIKRRNTRYPKGYNQSDGKGRIGATNTKKQNSQISRSLKGHKVSIETRAKIGKANRGKVRSEEFKKRLSEIVRNRPFTDKMRKHLDEARKKRIYKKGWNHTKETKLKISKAKKGKKLTSLSGENNSMTSLTKEQVIEIRKRYKPRIVSYRILADEYDVDPTTIANIVNRKTWIYV